MKSSVPRWRWIVLCAAVSCALLVLAAWLLYPHVCHAPWIPDARTWDPAYAARFEAVNARVKKGGYELVFIGDSITEGWEGAGKKVWERYYAPRNALNLGFSGDRTEHVLWRLDHGNIDGLSPKLAVLLIGTNNGPQDDAEAIARGICAVVKKLRRRLPDTAILLLAIFPRGPESNPLREKLAEASALAASFAEDRRVHYLDVGSIFMDEAGRIDSTLMPDFLHLSPKGYARWAEAMEPAVAHLMGETGTRP